MEEDEEEAVEELQRLKERVGALMGKFVNCSDAGVRGFKACFVEERMFEVHQLTETVGRFNNKVNGIPMDSWGKVYRQCLLEVFDVFLEYVGTYCHEDDQKQLLKAVGGLYGVFVMFETQPIVPRQLIACTPAQFESLLDLCSNLKELMMEQACECDYILSYLIGHECFEFYISSEDQDDVKSAKHKFVVNDRPAQHIPRSFEQEEPQVKTKNAWKPRFGPRRVLPRNESDRKLFSRNDEDECEEVEDEDDDLGIDFS